MVNTKRNKRESEAIWPAEAMREETRRALRGEQEDPEDNEQEKEEQPYFPKYDADKVRKALRTAAADEKEIQLHDPKTRYTAKYVGKVIKVAAEKEGLEERLGYIAGVVEKVDGTDSGRLYVLLKKGDRLEKEKCWFYSKQ